MITLLPNQRLPEGPPFGISSIPFTPANKLITNGIKPLKHIK